MSTYLQADSWGRLFWCSNNCAGHRSQGLDVGRHRWVKIWPVVEVASPNPKVKLELPTLLLKSKHSPKDVFSPPLPSVVMDTAFLVFMPQWSPGEVVFLVWLVPLGKDRSPETEPWTQTLSPTRISHKLTRFSFNFIRILTEERNRAWIISRVLILKSTVF